MAKAKKMENEVTVAETKEVGFSDLVHLERRQVRSCGR